MGIKRAKRIKETSRACATALCFYCMKEFIMTTDKPRQKYCSRECRNLDRKKFHGGVRECSICKKSFQPVQKKHQYCSRQCQDTAAELRRLKSREKPKDCPYCGQPLPPSKRIRTVCDRPECKRQRHIDVCKKREEERKKGVFRPKQKESLTEINEFRELMGLYKIEEEVIKCNYCGKSFLSLDKRANRTCPLCIENEERMEIQKGLRNMASTSLVR